MDIREVLKERLPVEYREDANVYITHPRGWDEIVSLLHFKLALLDPDYIFHQSKQKFGGLRFYARPSPQSDYLQSTFFDIVHEHENKAYKICQDCGGEGKFQTGWYLTLCDRCVFRREKNVDLTY